MLKGRSAHHLYGIDKRLSVMPCYSFIDSGDSASNPRSTRVPVVGDVLKCERRVRLLWKLPW